MKNLYHKDGRILCYGDKVRTMDGREYEVRQWQQPSERNPLGWVTLHDPLLKVNPTTREVYPTAIDASWK